MIERNGLKASGKGGAQSGVSWLEDGTRSGAKEGMVQSRFHDRGGHVTWNGAWNPVHKPLIMQCKHLIARGDWEVQISHCYREAN